MIFDSEQGVTPPRIRGGNMPRPVHEAANETVLLQFAVGTDGNVSSVQALQSEKGEDSASLPILVKAVSEWMFTPASNGTEPVPAHGKVLLIKGGDQFRYEVSTAFIASGKVQTPAAKPTANPGRIQVIEVPVEVRLEPDEAQKRLSTYVPAEYPAAAKAAGIHGSVLLAVKIAKDGTVRDVQPLSGPSELVAPAVEAVKKWHYAPAEFRGRPCQATTEVEIQFKLPE